MDNNHLVMFYSGRKSNDENTASYRSGQYIFISSSIPEDAYAHEVCHSLGILHTFSNDSKYTYMHGEFVKLLSGSLTNDNDNTDLDINTNDITDNLLDYIHTRKTTYKWQWDIIRNNVKNIK